MAVLRFLSALFLLIAVIAAVADATPYISGTGPFATTALADHWQSFSPATLQSARQAVVESAGAWAWDGALAHIINRPTFAVFGVLALLAGYAGRRRKRVNVYIN